MKISTLELIHSLLKEQDSLLETIWEDECQTLKALRLKRDAAEDEPEDEAVFDQEKRVHQAWEQLRSCREALTDWESKEWK